MYNLAPPPYNPSRHPMETWQEWYLANERVISKETEESKKADVYDPKSHENTGEYSEGRMFFFFFGFVSLAGHV